MSIVLNECHNHAPEYFYIIIKKTTTKHTFLYRGSFWYTFVYKTVLI